MTTEQTKQVELAQQQDTGTRAYQRWHRALLILCAFIGIGALFGGAGAFIAPDFFGASLLVPLFHDLPFVGQYIDSLALPGTALLLFVFVPQSLATFLLGKRHSRQYSGAQICGILLIAFTAVELILIPNPVSWLYLFFGVAELTIALLCLRNKR